jgi:hypothetical protein
MKTAQLGDIFEYEGELVQVQWINQGYKSIGFTPVNAQPCPCCGVTKKWDIIENSPLFQQGANPIKTIKGK